MSDNQSIEKVLGEISDSWKQVRDLGEEIVKATTAGKPVTYAQIGKLDATFNKFYSKAETLAK